MLSYQHAWHAGNRADVHKHTALVMLLRRLLRKPAPFCYVDAHAGRGLYDLGSEQARATNEAAEGFLRLDAALQARQQSAAPAEAAVPAAVTDYVELVRSFRTEQNPLCYPGSASLARAMLRSDDRAVLLELHPQEVAALRRTVGGDRRIGVHARDCFEGLPALLPPPLRRGLVLIDPSYEIKTEYGDIAALLAKAVDRWSNALYLIWYPLLAQARHRALLRGIAANVAADAVVSQWRWPQPERGLQGSGLVFVNMPWQLDQEFAAAMAFVVATLASGGAGRHELRPIAEAA